jgi:DNA-directed RNA polymerase subunit RPC12/RpoP
MRRTPVVNAPSVTLEHQCPQCGAPVSFPEEDRIFVCPYCRVRHFLFTGDYFRYYLPPLKSRGDDVFFVPYWRFKGLRVIIRGTKHRHEVVDRSACAAPHPNVPGSLGFRSQTLSLKFADRGMSGRCLPVRTLRSDFMESMRKVSLSLPSAATQLPPALLTGLSLSLLEIESEPFGEPYCILMGETASLIYSPFFIGNGSLYDGITGENLGSAEGLDVSKDAGQTAFPKTAFLPAICPDCGMDLHGSKESVVLACDQCIRLYAPSPGGLVGEEFFVAWPVPKADIWLPFWRIAVECSTGPLSSVADFYRFASVPKPIAPTDEQKAFHFLIPGFKINPDLFLKMAKLFTLYRAEAEKPAGEPPKPLHPVTVPAAEASQSIPAILVDTSPVKKRIVPQVSNSQFPMKTAAMVFVPFLDKGAEFVQPACNVAINKKALQIGKGL